MNIYKLYPKRGDKITNNSKVIDSTSLIIDEIYNDEQDELACADKLKAIYYDLSNDEKIEVNTFLKKVKYGKRQLNTMLKDYLLL